MLTVISTKKYGIILKIIKIAINQLTSSTTKQLNN
jgi:hypothetical protein